MDSKTLFVKQVRSHASTLTDLLSSENGAVAPDDIMERCIVCTRMLTGTTSLMEMHDWAELFGAFESVLCQYRDRHHSWDDRIAGVTGELIEKAETLVAAGESDPDISLASTVSTEEIRALINEITVAGDECKTTATPSVESIGAIPEPVGLEHIGVAAESQPSQVVESDVVDSQGAPLENVFEEIKNTSKQLLANIDAAEWVAREWNAEKVSHIRRDVKLLGFLVESIENVLEERAGHGNQESMCEMTPLVTAVRDYAVELSNSMGRQISICFEGDGAMDPESFASTYEILCSMMADIVDRCEVEAVEITITFAQRNGALHWQISDSGDNFVSDSQLDHEDQLAFYPRLKTVVRTLNERHGILWVEPGENRDSRFEFTLPSAPSPVSLLIWGDDQGRFAARSSQLCEQVPATTDKRGSDAYGEFVQVDGRRVPLIRLDVLFRDAPADGEMIVILGSVEKRVAFFTPGPSTPAKGICSHDAISVWKGAPHDVVIVDDQRIPAIEAGQLLSLYLDATSASEETGLSGGVLQDQSNSSQRQATFESTDSTPPDENRVAAPVVATLDATDDVDVLVVEQSESMRDALSSILSDQNISAALAGGIDEALDIIGSRAPKLIISEFRMPTMAAKRLVETMRDKGHVIPVLVTTSQTGKTADMLVEKLGVSGYLSKPIVVDEVESQLSCFLRGSSAI